MKYTLIDSSRQKILFEDLKIGDPCVICTKSENDDDDKDRLCVKVNENSFFTFDDHIIRSYWIRPSEILVYPVKSFIVEAEY